MYKNKNFKKKKKVEFGPLFFCIFFKLYKTKNKNFQKQKFPKKKNN